MADVRTYLDEIAREGHPTRLIGFTGGEPFMNRAFPAILEETLSRGFETLTLTNAMRPMMQRKDVIARLAAAYGPAMRVRISLDDHRAEVHDRERGTGSFAKGMEGLQWLASQGVTLEVAGPKLSADTEDELRAGFAKGRAPPLLDVLRARRRGMRRTASGTLTQLIGRGPIRWGGAASWPAFAALLWGFCVLRRRQRPRT